MTEKTIARLSQNGDFNIRGELVEMPEELRSGRNLIQGTHTDGFVPYINATVTSIENTPTKIIRAMANANGTFGIMQSTTHRKMQLTEGTQYIYSFDARGNIPILNYTYIMHTPSPNQSVSPYPTIKSETEFARFSIPFTKINGSPISYPMISAQGGIGSISWFEVKNIKIELGTSATPWSPAPEDNPSHDTPDWVQSGQGPFSLQEEGIVTGEFVEIPEELRGTGGRNLLQKTGKGLLYRTAYSTAVRVEDGKNSLVFNNSSDIIYLGADVYKLESGVEYTFSFYAKATKNMSIRRVYINPLNTNFLSGQIISTSWERYEFSFVAVGDGTTGIHMYPEIKNANGTFETFFVTEWKLEKGSSATQWTLAPEDLGYNFTSEIQHFDSSLGLSVNETGLAINGEYSEAPDTLRFNRTAYIEVNNPLYDQPNLEQEWTIEAVFKMDQSSVAGQFLVEGINSGIRISHSTTPLLYINSGVNDNYSYGKKNWRDGRFHHIAFSFKNQTGSKCIFVDGKDDTNYDGAHRADIPSGMSRVIKIGVGMLGCLSYVRIWDKSLDLSESSELIGKNVPNDSPNLVGYWKINEGYGNVVKDHSLNANHGVIIGGAEWAHSMDEEGG